jgi:putative endonuclease
VKQYYVYIMYIMASRSRTLYVGVTSDPNRRVWQHKHGTIPGFTKKYRITRLVYFDRTSDVTAAIEREKQIKGWTRARIIALIESINPTWQDLSDEWGEKADSSLRSE